MAALIAERSSIEVKVSGFASRLVLLAICHLFPLLSLAATDRPIQIHVVTDDNYPPYLFRNESGQVVGYLVDYWKLWENKTGVRVTLSAKRWAIAQEDLLAGKADVIDMLYKTPAREPYYDFSRPYADLPVNVYHHRSITGLADVDALRGHLVGVQDGDACSETLTQRGVTHKTHYPDYASLLAAAQREEVKIFCLDEHPANFYLNKLGLDREFRRGFTLYTGQFRRAVRKGQLDTLRLVEDGMARISAAEQQRLADKWFGQPLPTFGFIDAQLLTLIFLIVSGGAAASVLWVLTLRRRVSARTVELRRANDALEAGRTALVDSETRLKLATTAADLGIWVWDLRTNALTWDPRMRQLYQVPAEAGDQSMPYEFWRSCCHPDDRATTEQALQASVRDRTPFAKEFRIVLPDGAIRHIQAAAILELDEEGNPRRFVGINRDLSQQKEVELSLRKREAELRESESRYRQVIESLPLLIWTARPDGTCDYLSPQWVTYTGKGEAEQLGYNWLAQIHPDDRQRTMEQWLASAAEGHAFEISYRIRRHDGAYHWFRTLAVPVRLESGQIVKWFGSNTDIDDLMKAEQHWRESEANLRRLNDSLEELVLQRTTMLDEAQRIGKVGSWALELATGKVFWSKELYRIFGVEITESPPDIGTQADLMSRESWTRLNAALNRTRQTGEPYEIELEIRRADGVHGWLFARGEAVHDASGAITGLQGVAMDITARKQAETALQTALKSAEAATTAKSVFLANMSHEIRTPMNAILGYAHLLRRSPLDREQQDRVDKLSAAGTHLLTIINDILDLSKIEAGKVVLERIDFWLPSLLQDVASLVGEQASTKGLVIETDCLDAPDWLHGDPTRLRQAVLNFAGNAVKFTDRGKVTLRARCQHDDGQRLLMRFEVSDTGIGISADKQAALFQAFSQVDASTTRRFGGTGLGLTIARHIAALMGGEVGVRSEPGAGSTFWFTAWLEPGQHGVLGPAQSSDAESEIRRLYAGKKILLAEDDPINQEIAEALLAETGLHVSLAENGLEAVDMAAAEDFALILMDMQMPHMDGPTAARSIRAMPQRASTPILAMTANAFADDRHLCISAGMNDFIAKPVDPPVLYATLLKWLSMPDTGPATGSARILSDSGGANAPLVDLDVPLRALRDDACKVRALIDRFMASVRHDLPALERALIDCDWTTLKWLGHRLKSPARSLGMTQLGTLFKEIEACGEHQDALRLQGAAERIGAMVDRIAEVIAADPRLNRDRADEQSPYT